MSIQEREIQIEKMQKEDLEEIARIRMVLRPEESTFISRFGVNFSKDMLGVMFDTEPDLFLKATFRNRIVGYKISFVEFSKVSRRILLKLGPRFPFAVLTGRYTFHVSPKDFFNMFRVSLSLIMSKRERALTDSGVFETGVIKEFQHRGIGRRLTEEMITIMKKKGVKRIKTEVYADNVASLKMNTGSGAKIVSKARTPFGDLYTLVFDI